MLTRWQRLRLSLKTQPRLETKDGFLKSHKFQRPENKNMGNITTQLHQIQKTIFPIENKKVTKRPLGKQETMKKWKNVNT